MGRTLTCDVVNGIGLCIHNDLAPTDADWNHLISVFGRQITTLKGVLVWGAGPGPNAAQRKRLAEGAEGRVVPTAVITESILARGAITALRWLGQSISAYAPSELDAALACLPTPASNLHGLLVRAIQLRCELAGAPAPPQLAELDHAALKRELVVERSPTMRSA